MTDKERMEEFWVKIPEYPSYSVSNYGNVRNTRYDRDIRPVMRSSGYMQVNLYGYGGRQVFLVHRLVAKAFFEHFGRGEHVYHINHVKHDNAIVNLTLDPERVDPLPPIEQCPNEEPHDPHEWDTSVVPSDHHAAYCKGVQEDAS